jgi:hypothetical protein
MTESTDDPTGNTAQADPPTATPESMLEQLIGEGHRETLAEMRKRFGAGSMADTAAGALLSIIDTLAAACANYQNGIWALEDGVTEAECRANANARKIHELRRRLESTAPTLAYVSAKCGEPTDGHPKREWLSWEAFDIVWCRDSQEHMPYVRTIGGTVLLTCRQVDEHLAKFAKKEN